jgi:hypothetical protein
LLGTALDTQLLYFLNNKWKNANLGNPLRKRPVRANKIRRIVKKDVDRGGQSELKENSCRSDGLSGELSRSSDVPRKFN